MKNWNLGGRSACFKLWSTEPVHNEFGFGLMASKASAGKIPALSGVVTFWTFVSCTRATALRCPGSRVGAHKNARLIFPRCFSHTAF